MKLEQDENNVSECCEILKVIIRTKCKPYPRCVVSLNGELTPLVGSFSGFNCQEEENLLSPMSQRGGSFLRRFLQRAC